MPRLPGRNDPCPCGSGRKFKKCHLSGFEAWRRLTSGPTHLDLTEMKIAFCLAMAGEGLLREVDAKADALERQYFGGYPDGSVLAPAEAQERLIRWLQRLEVEMGRIAASDGRYFWLFLTQRIRASKQKFGTSELTVGLYRKVLKLAILKYGQMKGTAFTSLPKTYDARWWILRLDDAALPYWEPQPEAAFVPTSVSLEHIAKAILMERLAYDFCGAAALLRRVWKGGRLPVTQGCPGNAIHDPDTAWLIELYDERLRYSRVLSYFGSIVSPEFVPKMDTELVCLIPQPNLEEIDIPLVWKSAVDLDDDFVKTFRGRYYCPNYVVVPTSLRGFLKKAARFRSALAAVHGFLPEDLICYLVALSQRELVSWANWPRRRHQLWQRGYIAVVDEDTLVGDLASFFSAASGPLGRELSAEEAVRQVRQLTAALRYEEDDFGKIDLWNRSGLKLVLPIDNGILIDFHAIPDILHDLFEPLGKMTGDVGRLKGRDFEDEVAALIDEEVPGANVIWRRKVIARSTPDQREIDLAVVKGDVLFILQCKAHALDSSYDRGQPDALEKRESLNLRALGEADSLVRFLAANPGGRNTQDWEVPRHVRFVLGAVVSPFPEYVHERSERFSLSEKIPRICTPEEVCQFIKEFQLADYLGKSWLFKVQYSPD